MRDDLFSKRTVAKRSPAFGQPSVILNSRAWWRYDGGSATITNRNVRQLLVIDRWNRFTRVDGGNLSVHRSPFSKVKAVRESKRRTNRFVGFFLWSTRVNTGTSEFRSSGSFLEFPNSRKLPGVSELRGSGGFFALATSPIKRTTATEHRYDCFFRTLRILSLNYGPRPRPRGLVRGLFIHFLSGMQRESLLRRSCDRRKFLDMQILSTRCERKRQNRKEGDTEIHQEESAQNKRREKKFDPAPP